MQREEGKCRSCGADVIWVVLPSGNRCPLNAQRHKRPEGFRGHCYDLQTNLLDEEKPIPIADDFGFFSHFATCPDAQDWSKGAGTNTRRRSA